jgi:heme-degrading monooxygenase HmoA
MIVRRWRAVAENTAPYLAHFRRCVLPALRQVRGFRGAMVLRRMVPDAIEIEVLTLWDSMSAIHRFAGDNTERAVVEPEARAVLRRFERSVRHFEVMLDAASDYVSMRRRPTAKRSDSRVR